MDNQPNDFGRTPAQPPRPQPMPLQPQRSVPPQPPQRPLARPSQAPPQQRPQPVLNQQPLPPQPIQLDIEPAHPDQAMQIRKPRRWLLVISLIILVIIISIASAIGWFIYQLRPVDSANQNPVSVDIPSGTAPNTIASTLEENKVIKSSLAFSIYTRLNGVRNQLQAGSYQLAPNLSTPEVVSKLTGGDIEENILVVTFVPGATLHDSSDKPQDQKQDTYTTLTKLGYSDAEIEAAFEADYDMPELFAGKPASASLEGYIYGDTYHFDANTPAQTVIERSLMQFQTVVEENDLMNAYKKQGLTLYQGITLASIIEREVPDEADQKQAAQVFFTRMKNDTPLGSDVTAYYGARLIGKRPTVAVDTPYNTRIHKGLPPGPISTPGLTALLAVAHPAKGDYMYFLSGDDEKTYFAHTDKEHEKNIADHCEKKCSID